MDHLAAAPRMGRVADLSRARLWLTPDETQALTQQVESLLKPYRARRARARRPPEAEEIDVVYSVLPHLKDRPPQR
ncbi:MAG: hypothetical protein ACRDWY_08390 [Actinomycetes bacterium]